MGHINLERIYQLETTDEALDASARYLAEHMKPFLQVLEPVLICFPDEGPASIGGLFKKAVEYCDAMPVFWGPDYRWKSLLHTAFETHANTIVGHPLVILGLMKLAKATSTPLYFYDVIVCGDPFSHWMVNDLKAGLDCKVWGCYAVGCGPVVAGFSCAQEAGIHIREEVFVPHIEQVPGVDRFSARRGRLLFSTPKEPGAIFDPMERALVQYQTCSCGCREPRVVETASVIEETLAREVLEDKFLAWSSVLDYRSEITESGLSLELVVFPGESLPKLPSVARLKVRPWDPETDIPYCMQVFSGKISGKRPEKS